MKRRAGFTLIEVVVAFLIISACTAAILLGVVINMRQSKDSREQIMAQILASSTIDELRAHRFGSQSAPPGWSSGGSGWTRLVNVPAIVGGLPSPTAYALTLTPGTGQDTSGSDLVNLTLAWTEVTGDQKLTFDIPMPKGWNQQASRGTTPSEVSPNWHSPAAYTIPSEPSYRTGDTDHTVNPNVPDSGSIINGDTAKLQELVKELNAANQQLLADQKKVTDDQNDITATQAALSNAKAADPVDQSTVDALTAKLAAQQGQLTTDSGAVTQDQTTVDGLKEQIADG